MAATIATSQQDIKKVLAFSTVSQIGYMMLAVGTGAYVAAIFLMVAHAFYKALLFLGAGSVIHGLHDEQDLKKMGGLRPPAAVDLRDVPGRLAGHRRDPAACRGSGPRATCWPTCTRKSPAAVGARAWSPPCSPPTT